MIVSIGHRGIVDIRFDHSLVWCVFRLGKPMGQVH